MNPRHVPPASPRWACLPPASCRLLPAPGGKGILGMQCLTRDPLTQHCHGLPPTWDASVLPTFCGSPEFKPQGGPLFPILGKQDPLELGVFCRGSAAHAGVMCHREGQEKAGTGRELPLCWPGRRGAPSELSSRFPLLSPAPAAPYVGSPFPLDTRPYSNTRLEMEAARSISLH